MIFQRIIFGKMSYQDFLDGKIILNCKLEDDSPGIEFFFFEGKLTNMDVENDLFVYDSKENPEYIIKGIPKCSNHCGLEEYSHIDFDTTKNLTYNYYHFLKELKYGLKKEFDCYGPYEGSLGFCCLDGKKIVALDDEYTNIFETIFVMEFSIIGAYIDYYACYLPDETLEEWVILGTITLKFLDSRVSIKKCAGKRNIYRDFNKI
jgi:hypothetical protein